MVRYAELVRQINIQIDYLWHSRAVFPHMQENMIGAKDCHTAPYYQNLGFNITFSFAEPLTAESVAEIDEIGHWINQNFVVRLCALLEFYKVIGPEDSGIKINHQLDGHDEVDITRRLRNEFAHTAGEYDPADPKARELYERIVNKFSLGTESNPEIGGKFPIPIDKVLIPLAEGCKHYIKALADTRHRAA